MSSLFAFSDTYIRGCERYYHFTVSKQFVDCADHQLTAQFEKQAGFKVTKNVSIGWETPFIDGVVDHILQKGPTTVFLSQLWIGHTNNPVKILWKSNSGRIYEMHDTDIDCSDIEFWFEGMDPVLFNKLMFPKTTLPFKLKDPGYELSVIRLQMDCTISLWPKEAATDTELISKQLDDFIAGFNDQSEKKNRKDGVVHNWKHHTEPGCLVYEFDMGSAGFVFLKKFLSFLSKMALFSKAQVD
jgi:hypothetical protein